MTSLRRLALACTALLVAVGVFFTHAALGLSQAHGAQPLARVQPPSSVTARASASPPSSAGQHQPVIGNGDLMVQAANSPHDEDSFWIESIDIDGDGQVEDAEILWDDEDEVLYFYAEGPLACHNGGQGNGAMLMAIYGDGNPGRRVAGSGWYVVDLDAGECGARAGGLLGCRFDASGRATECGAAIIRSDEVGFMPIG